MRQVSIRRFAQEALQGHSMPGGPLCLRFRSCGTASQPADARGQGELEAQIAGTPAGGSLVAKRGSSMTPPFAVMKAQGGMRLQGFRAG